jgi:hypothetical protein
VAKGGTAGQIEFLDGTPSSLAGALGGVGDYSSDFSENGGNSETCQRLVNFSGGADTLFAAPAGGSVTGLSTPTTSTPGDCIFYSDQVGGAGAYGTGGNLTATSGVRGGGGVGCAINSSNAFTATSGAGGNGLIRVTVYS